MTQPEKPIRGDDRISAVLARDERMLDALLAASPTFSHLKNPVLRKTMAKLATVEQAARIAGIDAGALLARLNATLAGEAPQAVSEAPRAEAAVSKADVPSGLATARARKITECDVREDLRAGREPFQTILRASRQVADGEALRLRAIFEPAPLYAVLGRQGFSHFTERLADDDWCVWFWREPGGAATQAPANDAAPAPIPADAGDDVTVLDVRGLEPPEPMVRTLEALEQLPRGKTLMQINVRVPQFLLPQLQGRGFVYEIREQSADLVRIFIRHAQP